MQLNNKVETVVQDAAFFYSSCRTFTARRQFKEKIGFEMLCVIWNIHILNTDL